MRAFTLFVFFAVLLAPAGSLLFGAAPPYGRPQADFPAPEALWREGGAALGQFGQAVLDRAPARRLAISAVDLMAKAALAAMPLDLTTGRVVFGRDGWMFFAADFKSGCDVRERWLVAARRFELMRALAAVSGQRFIMTVAPDKSAIYPDKLGRTLSGRADCRAKAAEQAREALAAVAPHVLDPAKPLSDWRRQHPGDLLYIVTDTHWNDLGAAIGLRQLAAAVLPGAAFAPPALSGETRLVRTDLANVMLLLDAEERVPLLDEEPEEAIYRALAKAPFEKIAMLHDSFHGPIMRRWAAHDRRVVNLGYQKASEEESVAAMAAADLLLVEMIERDVLPHLEEGWLDWEGGLGRALLARNAALAARCAYRPVAPEKAGDALLVRTRDLRRDGDVWRPAGDDPQFVVQGLPADGAVCIRIRLDAAAPAMIGVFLQDAGGASLPGGEVRLPVTAGADQAVAVVLPAELVRHGVRIDPGVGAQPVTAVRRLEIGTLEATPAGPAP